MWLRSQPAVFRLLFEANVSWKCLLTAKTIHIESSDLWVGLGLSKFGRCEKPQGVLALVMPDVFQRKGTDHTILTLHPSKLRTSITLQNFPIDMCQNRDYTDYMQSPIGVSRGVHTRVLMPFMALVSKQLPNTWLLLPTSHNKHMAYCGAATEFVSYTKLHWL